jgi:hypothetical protein
MNTQELYFETIAKLKRNERPLIKLNPELIDQLKTSWSEAVQGAGMNAEILRQVLCILDNTQNASREFNELFFQTMEKLRDPKTAEEIELLIYTLGASQKHVIGEALKSGVMINGVFFDQLKSFLDTKNPEILEWTMRTIETMGPLSLRFKKEIQTLRPSIMKIFNQHQKAAFQIVELLEKEWSRMKL